MRRATPGIGFLLIVTILVVMLIPPARTDPVPKPFAIPGLFVNTIMRMLVGAALLAPSLDVVVLRV